MMIKSIDIRNEKEFAHHEFHDFTLIHSSKNTEGKTSLVRFIIYGLGYNIPITSRIDPTKYRVELKISINNKSYRLIRKNRLIDVICETTNESKQCEEENTKTFLVSTNNSSLLSYIFGSPNKQLLLNILGVFYIDQEKGWSMFRKGNVVQHQYFSVEQLLYGMSGLDDGIFKRRKIIKNQIEDYSKVIRLYNVDSKLDDYFTQDQTIDDELQTIFEEIQKLNIELDLHTKLMKSYKNMKNQNERMWDYIHSLKLSIKVDGKSIKLTKDNIEGLEDSYAYIDAKLRDEEIRIVNIKNNIELLKNKQSECYSQKKVLSSFKFKPVNKQIKINIEDLKIKHAILSDQLKAIDKEIEENTSNSDYESRMNAYLKDYSEQLGVQELLGKKLITETNFEKLTGAESQKVLLAYRLAMLRTTSEYLSIKLPIIIDSISRETDSESLEMMISFIHSNFSEHQFILSSIEDRIESDNIIEIENRLMTPIDKTRNISTL